MSYLCCQHSVFHNRSKHPDVSFCFVRTAVENNFIKIDYLNTNCVSTDILTKGIVLLAVLFSAQSYSKKKT